ncbi:MAG: glutamine--tRNA ligase/YqeY domain fusion protein [bacterium]|nr:glutamine--tRNA ligase/YqeY domain fusion protein [bacterium]
MTIENENNTNFIKEIIKKDLNSGANDGRVATRFPPEPNGFLHIGHAKSICLNFGLAEEFKGLCNLRFDDTNPTREETKYVEAIKEDVRWLGFDWEDRLYFASDYFDQLYEFALHLVNSGKAYVDDLSADEIREYRGTLTEPGQDSPYRERTVDENLDLFERMRAGEFADGSHVLRAKIDMAHPNMVMRDPTIYRIRRAHHHRTGDKWCIYPMYDFTHCLSDAIEGITHSVCTLEFENNRALYDWFIENVNTKHTPHQYEFARLELTHTLMSKRKLLKLVEDGIVVGWDDPRLPTIAGIRRRGYPPEAMRTLAERVGVAKKRDTMVEYGFLEHAVRENLNLTANRVMAVLDPLKLVIENYPEDKSETFEIVNNPEDESAGSRQVPFSREVYIERGDFMEEPPRKFFRLSPGREVRLRGAYLVTCESVVKDPDTGEVVELRCKYDPESRGGDAPDGRKVKGTLHWVSASHAVEAEVRLYDHLFLRENMNDIPEGSEFTDFLNPDSLTVVKNSKLEPSVANASAGDRFQFLRHGYFCVDSEDSEPNKLVFNRTVSLRDSWGKGRK